VINVRIDSLMLQKTLRNTIAYSNGFLEGVEIERINFNRILGGITAEALGEYIDQKARMNPGTLHHVYEWERVGDKSARLFKFSVNAGKTFISFDGGFLSSKSTPPGSNSIFYDKANVMENKISVIVSPKNSSVLRFEDEGEVIFTTKSIYIANPGGDAVAGSFGSVVDEFFQQYFTASIFEKILKDLSTPSEFAIFFPQGARSNGRSIGVAAGRRYFRVKGAEM